MPSPRSATGRSLAILLLAAFVLGIGAPAAVASPASAGSASAGSASVGSASVGSVGASAPGRRGGGAAPRLHGQLAGLVTAIRQGRRSVALDGGFVTAPVPLGRAVAVTLHLDPTVGQTALASLLARGAWVANRSGNDVEAYLPPAALAGLATLPGIASAAPIIRPVPMGSTGLGTVVGEGVALHHADQWQAAGITGAGVKVGIIDGGFLGLSSRLGRELPATVRVRCYREVGVYSTTVKSCEDFTEHGTAVAETISDMAPGAGLYLADPVSMQDLQSTVAWMTANGVKIINVSLGFAFQGPGDDTSPPDSIYAVVDQAVKAGALWVNAAGNAAEDGWTGTWRDINRNGTLEFSGVDEGNSIFLDAGDTAVVTLRWNDTWGASSNDFDLYVYGSDSSVPLAASEDPQVGDQDPVESLSFTPSTSGTYRIVITRAAGSGTSRLQLLVLTSADTALQYRTAAGTLPSPADGGNPGMLSVGAVSFDAPDTIEPYSSRGPTPAGRIRPDLVAADCTSTTMINPFCGTSEAAPYTAGAAALVAAARPNLSPAGLADWLRQRAVPLGSPSPNATYGSGRLDLGAPPPPPAPTSLAIAAQPGVAVVGVPLAPAPVVQILDQDGRLLASGPGASSLVTLTAARPAGGIAPVLSCDGGLTQAAVGGVAAFSGCTFAGDATGVTVVATSGFLPAVASSPFDVVPAGAAPAPSVALGTSAAAIVWGTAVTLTATLDAAAGTPVAAPLAGRTVVFQRSTDRATWTAAGSAVTDGSGTATLAYRPATNLYYRATLAGAADLGPATSDTSRVTVRQIALMRPSNRGAVPVLARGQSVTFTTLVRPARADVPPGSVSFQLAQLVGSRWVVVETRVVPPNPAGSASLVITFGQPGRWAVRSMALPTAVNANSVWTAQEQFQVR